MMATPQHPPRSRRARRRSSSALVILTALFAVSAAIRMGEGAGLARAWAQDGPAAMPAPGTPGDAATPSGAPTATPAAGEADLRDLLAQLAQREAAVSAREAKVADRTQAIALAETAVTARLTSLEQAEARLAATLAIADKAAETDLARLTAVYESMKPKDAATLFATMAPEFAAGFVGRMRPAAAAAIMAGLPSDRAYAVSLILAGRNANAPTQ